MPARFTRAERYLGRRSLIRRDLTRSSSVILAVRIDIFVNEPIPVARWPIERRAQLRSRPKLRATAACDAIARHVIHIDTVRMGVTGRSRLAFTRGLRWLVLHRGSEASVLETSWITSPDRESSAARTAKSPRDRIPTHLSS